MNDIYTSKKSNSESDERLEPSAETLILIKNFARLYEPLRLNGEYSTILPN